MAVLVPCSRSRGNYLKKTEYLLMTAYGILNTRELNANHYRLAIHAATFIVDLHFAIHIRPVQGL
jgi:hypothetical protein